MGASVWVATLHPSGTLPLFPTTSETREPESPHPHACAATNRITNPPSQAMLAFVRDGAGISATEAGGAGAGASGGDGGGDRKGAMGGVLELDPELLSVLEEKGTEALVAAFVEGGDVDSIPGWAEATKGLQGEVSECVREMPAVVRFPNRVVSYGDYGFSLVLGCWAGGAPLPPTLAFVGMVVVSSGLQGEHHALFIDPQLG